VTGQPTMSMMGFNTERRDARRLANMDAGRLIPEADRWNHNIHYFDVLLGAVPTGARSALDVGCGDGMLARRLAHAVERVVGIDRDAEQIELAKASTTTGQLEFVQGDVMTYPLAEKFDAVLSVATLHHLPTEAALQRLADLAAPGGVVAIVGLARSTRLVDLANDGVGTVLTQVLKPTGGRRFYEHSAPIVWPPDDSHATVRRIAAAVLPGAVYRRHALWRYTLVWRQPVDDVDASQRFFLNGSVSGSGIERHRCWVR
jgi:2-polyprenyl-3-methyl-5-hydroxy-6-metoxy-1,4-benzoquinol methylase